MTAAEISQCLINDWLDPKYIIPAIITLISSGLVPFLLHKYKLNRERANNLFQTRKEQYKLYFLTIDEAAKLANQNYSLLFSETIPNASLRMLYENTPEAIVNFQSTIYQATASIQQGFQKALSELVGIRLVCSTKVEQLLNKFEAEYQELLALTPQLMQEMKSGLTEEAFATQKFNFETPTRELMVTKGAALEKLRKEVIQQMRKELGYKD